MGDLAFIKESRERAGRNTVGEQYGKVAAAVPIYHVTNGSVVTVQYIQYSVLYNDTMSIQAEVDD